MTEKKPAHILISSTLATVVVTALTNPLDVLKVRIQNNDKVNLHFAKVSKNI